VRISEGNAVGARAPNIFNEVAKFQKRFEDMKQKSATRESQVIDASSRRCPAPNLSSPLNSSSEIKREIQTLRAGVRGGTAVEDVSSSQHQIHVQLVVLAAIRVRAIGPAHHCPRFAPPAAAAGGGTR
jgi:hypothetical protein